MGKWPSLASDVGFDGYDRKKEGEAVGFCPLVCLPSSDGKFSKLGVS